MPTTQLPVQGLTDEAVAKSRAEHGRNVLTSDAGTSLFATVKEVVTEPMFLLLVAACTIYFVLGRIDEAITLIVALLLVSGISVYQSIRSDKALGALRTLTQPKARVRRNGELAVVPVEDIVVGDAVLVEEGEVSPLMVPLTTPTISQSMNPS
ncbi:cation-transporting P-type ATPase [Spirosoma telluris]|uniref:cation-transporting P-type ATPase n=1 Tax=Spirosoma telluris TaxID=2183553 RepID=UPI002FC318D7